MNENTVFDIVYLMIYADIKGKSWNYLFLVLPFFVLSNMPNNLQ